MARIPTRSAKDYEKYVCKVLPNTSPQTTDLIILDCPQKYEVSLIKEMKKYGFSRNIERKDTPGIWFTRIV